MLITFKSLKIAILEINENLKFSIFGSGLNSFHFYGVFKVCKNIKAHRKFVGCRKKTYLLPFYPHYSSGDKVIKDWLIEYCMLLSYHIRCIMR